MITRICSICKKELGDPFEKEIPEIHISHGICRSCLDDYMKGSGISLNEFMDSLPVPVFAVDVEGRVQAANKLGRETVSKQEDQIAGFLGGEVFQCHYSTLPGGCGQTPHCKSCVIRNSVMKTHSTGEPCIRVPACQDLDTITGTRTIRFLISTKLAGDVVLLFIDDIQPLPDAGEEDQL